MSLSLTCYGGVDSVTGANFMLSHGDTRILIDCGLTQGADNADERNRAPFAYDPASVQCVCATHAHIDHIGLIPKLVRDGFSGVIYSTPVTREIAELMFEDALGIMDYKKREENIEPLYGREDVERAFTLWKAFEYYEPRELADGITLTFRDAGHILGSAMCEFVCSRDGGGTTKVLCTGDLGNDKTAILRPTDSVSDIDYLLMDSVYGDRVHEDASERRERFMQIIRDTIGRGGALMVPAFSLERTQDILYLLNDMIEGGHIPSVPVYLDSPLAIRVTEVYRRLQKYMSKAALEKIGSGDNIFDFPKLELTREGYESREINDVPNPKIVIAGSGMSTGGRILHHEKRYLPDEKSTLLLVGYQSVGTLGRTLEDGARDVRIDGHLIPVRARVERLEGFSAHKDADGLMGFVAQTDDTVKRVFVAMGEPKSALTLTQRLRDYLGVDAMHPKEGKEYTLH